MPGSGAPTRRKTRAAHEARSTKTKKKNIMIEDETTFLEDETKASLVEFSLNETLVSAFENADIMDAH